MDVLIVEAQAARLDRICHVAVEHPDPAHLGVVGDPDGADIVVGHGGDLARAPSSVPVRVVSVVAWHRISVVVVYVEACERVLDGRNKQIESK